MRGEPAPRRTSADRYRDAVRATHLISTELADIEDEEEYDKYLMFLLEQWRNVRQRKRLRVDLVQPDGEHAVADAHGNDIEDVDAGVD